MRERENMWHILSIAGVFFAIIIALAACLFLFGCADNEDAGGGENFHSELPQITNITVKSSSYEYDGAEHGIDLVGVLASDKIYYSIDGTAWTDRAILYSDIGEHRLYFKVVREGYAEYYDAAVIVITPPRVANVLANDVFCVFGNAIVPKLDGLEIGDVVKYSVNGGEYSDDMSGLCVGEYVVSYSVARAGANSITGTFKLTVLPNISGTYLGCGKRITLGDTTAMIDGNECAMVYGIDGSGQISVDGENLNFLVADGALEINQERYILLAEGEQVLELRINGTFYCARRENNEVSISFEDDNARIDVGGERLTELENYDFCESVLGAENVKYDYAARRVEFEAAGEFVDITLSNRPAKLAGELKQTVLYDGAAHVIDGGFENAVYLYGDVYETEQRGFTDIGEHVFTAFVMSDGYLPQAVDCTLKILPDLSGTYVASDSVLQIDGLNAKLNGAAVDFELGLTKIEIDGKTATPGDGIITLDGVVYAKTEAKLFIVAAGGAVFPIERRPNAEYALIVTEGVESSHVEVVNIDMNVVVCSMELDGTVTGAFVNRVKWPALDGTYYFSETDMADSDVAWIVVEVDGQLG